jgi:hypothetical protein
MNAPFRIEIDSALGAADPVRLARLDDARECAAIEAFLGAHADATPFHRPAWLEAVAQGTGNPAMALVSGDHGAVQGYLPLNLIHSPIFGRLLASSGFAVGGGLLLGAGVAAAPFFAALEELAVRLSCPAVELRGGCAPTTACISS